MARPMMLVRSALRLLGVATLVLTGCATVPQLPDRFAVGRDINGYRCSANRNWHDASAMQFDKAYVLSCEGASASRTVATVSVVPIKSRKPEAGESCGAPSQVTLAGIGPADVRRCFDSALAASAVVIRFNKDGSSYRAATDATATGPTERVLEALVKAQVPTVETAAKPASFDFTKLAAAPAQAHETPTTVIFDPAIALREGIADNRQGLYVEASRMLNDALSRLPVNTPQSVQTELLLEAALADSNISFVAAAREHFDAASKLLDQPGLGDRTAFLERKRSTYRALDALNRRDWAGALSVLQTAENAFPLKDPGILADLNRDDSGGAASAVAGPSAAQLAEIVLDAQRGWAGSIAMVSKGGPNSVDAGQAALNRAAGNVATLLNARVDPSSLLWLASQIERQAGRIDARRASQLSGPGQAQAYGAAVAKFDCALAILRGLRPANEQLCAIPLTSQTRNRAVAASSQVTGPVIAETQIERASLLVLAGAPDDEILKDNQQGIEALIASGRGGSSAPAGLESYLDLLTRIAKEKPGSVATEQFFQAIQAVGEPGIARQISQLAQLVSANGQTAGRLRERAELDREIAALRYQIADNLFDEKTRDGLDRQRQEKERRKLALDEELASDSRARAIDDRPITVAQVQAALQPDEVYFKLAEIRTRTYGIVIGKSKVAIYAVALDSRSLEDLSRAVRLSILSGGKTLPLFKVAASYTLFHLIAGPAQADILAAKSVIVDPAGPLSALPAGVLVTDLASQKAYAASQKKAPYDYSKVSFLADRVNLSIALSPRSFLDARALPPSRAIKPFIGFGQHSAPADPGSPTELEQVGLGCPISRGDLIGFSERNRPISAATITAAANAFGTPDAPKVIGADFTDTAIQARTDLNSYEVLHFATHGIPETKVGCATVPPALITTIGGPTSDGFLSFSEVAGLNLDANLVVLAACETSASASAATARRSGQEDSGRSLDGLVRAFLTANARAVLATYWSVSDEQDTDQLFDSFYRHGRSETIGASLREAQHDLIHQPDYSHPFYWGAYFVVGDTSKTMLSKGPAIAAK